MTEKWIVCPLSDNDIFKPMHHLPSSVKHISNGGIEQAFLEAANEDDLLSERDKERLNHLKSLPKNRT